MATMVQATEPADQPTWEIQRDAFAPPPTRRILRGWDRAPVSARAPRLQGQKVWKKMNIKTTQAGDVQNEAQEELEKEGAGARKKSRMLTSRENINDAMWAEVMPEEFAKDIATTLGSNEEQLENLNTQAVPAVGGLAAELEIPLSNSADSPKEAKQDPAMAILQFIPRKRTNTDHVITPKKPLRQTTLDHKEQALCVSEERDSITAKTTRARKSLRKSIVASISENTSESRTSKAQARLSFNTEHLPNNENAAPNSKESKAPAGKPVNKRRASRRSNVTTRRSMAYTERTSEIGHTASRSTEVGSEDASKPYISILDNSITPGEVIVPLGADEPPATSDTTVITGLNRTLSESSRDPNQTAGLLTAKSDVQLRDAVEPNVPEASANGGEDIEQVQAAFTEGDISTSIELKHFQYGDTFETQKSLSELNNLALGSTTADQLVAKRDESRTDGGSVAEQAKSSGPIGNTGTIESGYQLPQAESTVSQKSPAELDVPQEIQTTEAPEVPDSSNLAMAYDHDDTDMLRKFLTRVKANKAAKNPPKRKRSLPHSPLRIPLGDLDNNASPSPLQLQKSSEINVVEPSPSKRKKKPSSLAQCENEPEPRRSGRTKPPLKEPPGAPSFIPVRRLGQDIDTTVILKRNEEKELAALTRVNTRKNKGGALTALEVLAKKSEEKEDPVMRQKLLKEVYDEKMEKSRLDKEKKGREKKSVTWAEELAQFQNLTKGTSGESNDDKENEKVVAVVHGGEEQKQGAVRVGVRSKAALGMVLNGTPAPKRKMRGRV